ncbi:MAG: glycosyl hydrolase 53 family protein [Clostridia bacterium]|nr:glycosyl hydrolase 53 family protein [Clostridia bacterium]
MKKEKQQLAPEQKKKRLQKSLIIAGAIVMAFVIVIVSLIGAAVAASKRDDTVANGTLSMLGNLLCSKNSIQYQTFENEGRYADEGTYHVENFRVSMSAMNHWEDGTDYATYDYTYTDEHGHNASTLKGLQEMFNYYGATEMYVRINTTRYYPTDTTLKDYYHIRMHCLEESLKACAVAKQISDERGEVLPINVELGVFEGYSDAFESQYPVFDEYPELDGVYPKDANGKRKAWDTMSLDEICAVLRAYGTLVANEIKATGATVEIWDLGNETNYGFGGVMLPLKSAVSKATSKQFWVTYLKSGFGVDWLAKNVWCYNAKMFAALKEGILEVYPTAKFSSHISTVTVGEEYVVKYFKTLAENGYEVDQAGISFYPNATSVMPDKIAQIKKIVLAVNRELGKNVMLAEYGYANESGLASGTFSSWNNKVHGYELTDDDGAKFLKQLISWGKENGMAGIRPWAPELDWANPWFNFDKEHKTAEAKQLLFDALKEATEH